jgi:WD40 repeat protein
VEVLILTVCAAIAADDTLPPGAVGKAQLLTGATVTFTPDGTHLVARYYHGGFVIIPAESKTLTNEELLRKEHGGDCALSWNSKWIVTKDGEDAPIIIFQLPQLKQIRTFKAAGKPVAISDDGTKVVVCETNEMIEVRSEDGAVTRKEVCNKARVEMIRWLKDGGIVFKHGVGNSNPAERASTLMLFGKHETNSKLPVGAAVERPMSATISHNETVLAVTYGSRHIYGGSVMLYNLRNGSIRNNLARELAGEDYSIGFGSRTDLLAVGGATKTETTGSSEGQGIIQIYDAQRGTRRALQIVGSEPIISIRFSADDSQFVTGTPLGEVIVWNTKKVLGEK